MEPRCDPERANPDASYCRFGAEALLKLLETIRAQVEGVAKSEDIEYVHKMRVTSRRIRAAMPLFKECFPKKRYKKWLNEIKQVTRFLGAARDLDVQITFVNEYIKQLQPDEPKKGIEALLNQHVNQRSTMQTTVVNGLDELNRSSVLQQTARYCKRIFREANTMPFNLHAVREKAFWQISFRLDDFLALEPCVHEENEVLKHHEMRIKAKWLRYTMEAFAPLYQGELAKEIQMMRTFQDTLGEMHDCDVWISTIPQFIAEQRKETANVPGNEKTEAEDNQDLLKFLDYIKQKRRGYYEKFVGFWEENVNKNAFEELRKSASAGFAAAESITKAELANPFVKVGVIADIHSNIDALDAVLLDAERRGITVFLNAGDTVGFGAFPNEVIKALYCKNTLNVIGNFDVEVLDKKIRAKGPQKFSADYTRKTLAKAYGTYLLSLPSKVEVEIGHKKLVMTHGAEDLVDEQLSQETVAPEKVLEESAATAGADIIVSTHAHEQFTKKSGETISISPGSVGKPRDGNPQAAYAVITVNPFAVELLRINYDVQAAADGLRRNGAPESYAQMLLRGLSLSDIIAEDTAKEKDLEEKCLQVAEISQTISRQYCPETGHSEQVRKMALELFDSLQDLHRLGKRERCWLECAAILHDIGLANGRRAHQKNTLKLILNETRLPFSSVERQVIANVARYHRKGCPKSKDYSFMSLPAELKQKVRTLAGILRLADALDFSHQSMVQKVEVHVAFDFVTVEAVVSMSPVLEESAVSKKKDMFEQSFKKKLMVAWKQVKPPQPVTTEQPLTPVQEPAPSLRKNSNSPTSPALDTKPAGQQS